VVNNNIGDIDNMVSVISKYLERISLYEDISIENNIVSITKSVYDNKVVGFEGSFFFKWICVFLEDGCY